LAHPPFNASAEWTYDSPWTHNIPVIRNCCAADCTECYIDWIAGAHFPFGHLFARYPTKGVSMNWDQIEGKWKQLKGAGRERWGKLTDDDWERAAGKKDQLIGRLQERYGIAKDEAAKQADEWSREVKESKDEPTVRRAGKP
jgi:uncharacterized protein YjbJ (UPF0337 family)